MMVWQKKSLVVTGRGIPRAHCTVRKDGEVVGEVTSGTFSPTRKEGIALAHLERLVLEGRASRAGLSYTRPGVIMEA